MEPINWKCPYCGHAQTATFATHNVTDVRISNDRSKHGKLGGRIKSLVCSNMDCRELVLQFALHRYVVDGTNRVVLETPALHEWPLLPESSAKPQPDYIPEPIVEDYKQACRIRDLSPNASATMSRRCLQGMIRDFCEITKPSLKREIDHLRELVEGGDGPRDVNHDTMLAIDNVREMGNIGAHMEKDINLILDVEPGEAQALIELIEILFEEWYVAKSEREAKLERLGDIVGKKKSMKEQARDFLPGDEPAVET